MHNFRKQIADSLGIALCLFVLCCAVSDTQIYAAQSPTLTLLNPISHPKTGDTWKIEFTTASDTQDLLIIPDDQPTIDDLTFKGLYCDKQKKPDPLILTNSIRFIKDYTCAGTSSVHFLVNQAGDHSITLQYGQEKQTAHNSGVFVWSERLGGTSDDKGYSVNTDTNNRVILTGVVNGDADLNGDGDTSDTNESSSGYGNNDILISVFDSAGVFIWSERLGGINSDYGYSVTTDTNNRVIVTGYVLGDADLNGDGDTSDTNESGSKYGPSYYDIFISVFDSGGTFAWSQRLGGSNSDAAISVTTDTNNRVIITGSVNGDADLNGDGDTVDANESSSGYGGTDIYISVFSSTGTFAWSERLGGITWDIGNSVAADSNNRIIVSGYVTGNADLNGDGDTADTNESSSGYGAEDVFISLFDSNGVFAWSERLGGTYSDQGYSITADTNNRIIVSGYVTGNADLNGDGDTSDTNESNSGYGAEDVFISVFDSNGVFAWSERLGGGSYDYGYSVTTDTNNQVVVTGTVRNYVDLNGDGIQESGGYGGNDIYISVFSSTGTFAWSERLGGGSWDVGQSVATDTNNRVIVTGFINSNADINGDGDTGDVNENGTGYGMYDVFLSVFGPDIVPPISSFFNPESGTTIFDPIPTISFGTDEEATCRLSFTDESYDEMSDNVTCDGGGTTNQSCNSPDLGEDGLKNVYVACTDGSGNKNTSETNENLVYTLDTSPPTPSSVSPTSGSTITDNTPTLTFSLDENGDCYASTSDKAYSEMGVGDTNCTGDGTQSISCTMSDLGSDGEKNISISCQDTAGNQDTADTNEDLMYTLADTTPATKLSFSPVSGTTIVDSTPTITFTTDENATCRLSLTDESYDDMSGDVSCDGGGTTSQSCTSSDLGTDGAKNVYIACTDGSGNKDTSETNENLTYSFVTVTYETATLSTTMPATNGTVYSIVDDGTSTYVGGDFSMVAPSAGMTTKGGVVNTSDGSLVAPFPKVNGTIYTSVSDGVGGWYIGGEFTQVGDTEISYLAHISTNGTLDTSFTPSANSTVYALALSGDYLYVGGGFNSIGGQDFQQFARVNKTTGLADATCNPQINAEVLAIYLDGNLDIYVGGGFTLVGGTQRVGLAKLASDCSLDTGWVADADTAVSAITGSGSDIYVGGGFSSIDNDGVGEGDPVSQVYLAKLSSIDGTVDQSFNPVLDGSVYALSVSGDYLYAGGWFETVNSYATAQFARLNKSTGVVDTDCDLDIVGGGGEISGEVRAITVSGDYVYFGGNIHTVAGDARGGIAKVSTSNCSLDATFKPNTATSGRYVYTISSYGDNLYVGGNFENIGWYTRNNIAKIDNVTGNIDETFNPNPNGGIYSLALNEDSLYIMGGFSTIGETEIPYLAKVTTTTGAVDESFLPAPNNSTSNRNTLLVANNSLYVGGGFTEIGSLARTGIAKLDLATGSADENFNANIATVIDSVYGLSYSDSSIFFGGPVQIGGTTYSVTKVNANTGALDETFTNPVINESYGNIYATAVSGDYLYLGGSFSSVGAAEIAEFARVNKVSGEVDSGCNLQVVTQGGGGGGPETVYVLSINNTTGYVGGDFTSVMGNPVNSLFRFNTTTCTYDENWTPNPTSGGNPAYVYALSVSDTDVWAGGNFDTIENESIASLARFTLEDPVTPTPTPTSTPTPTPQNTGPTATPGPNPTLPPLIQERLDNGFDANGECIIQKPGGRPEIFRIDMSDTSATLYIAPPAKPYTRFFITYKEVGSITQGESTYSLVDSLILGVSTVLGAHPVYADSPEYAIDFSHTDDGGVVVYTINELKPNTKYEFTIKCANKCAFSETGNTLGASTSTKGSSPTKTYLASSTTSRNTGLNPISALVTTGSPAGISLVVGFCLILFGVGVYMMKPRRYSRPYVIKKKP